MNNEVHIASKSCLMVPLIFHLVLKFGYLWRLPLPALMWRQLCSHTPCIMKPKGALLDFQLSVNFPTTCQSPQCQRSACHHTIPPTRLPCAVTYYLTITPLICWMFDSWLTVFLYRGLLSAFLVISRITEVIHLILASVFLTSSPIIFNSISLQISNPIVIH